MKTKICGAPSIGKLEEAGEKLSEIFRYVISADSTTLFSEIKYSCHAKRLLAVDLDSGFHPY